MTVPTIARPAAATYGRPTECDSVKPILIGAYWAPMLRPTSPDEMETSMASISIKRFRSHSAAISIVRTGSFIPSTTIPKPAGKVNS